MPLDKSSNAYFSSSVWHVEAEADPEMIELIESDEPSSKGAGFHRQPSDQPLPEALFDDNPSLEEYRRDYRNFRRGHFRGAVGEGPRTYVPEDDLDDLDAGGDVVDAVYATVHAFRMGYRYHRIGHARGAKGEISEIGKKLTKKSMLLLPTIQLHRLRQHLKAYEENRELAAASTEASLRLGGLHLHVGAGRLGLGLILPAMVGSGRPLVVLQRPSAAWVHAGKAARITIQVNGKALTSLRVLRTVAEARQALADGEKAMLVLSEEQDLLQMLVQRSSSYSCSIGGKELSGALDPLLRAVRTVAVTGGGLVARPPLYCCENDHDAVEKLEPMAGKYVELVPVLVDRVCTDRDLAEDGSISVTAEPYLGDIVIPPPKSADTLRGALPFGGPTVRLPTTAEGAEFLHRKKILTVNGTHTTLAFLTLAKVEPETVGLPQASHELLAFDLEAAISSGPGQSMDVGRVCWVWAVARQLMLMDEFPIDVLRHTLGDHGGDGPLSDGAVCEALVQGARDAVGRLSVGGDETGRVLGGGVVNRWKGRLANVAEWLQSQQGVPPLWRELTKAANINIMEMRQCIDWLVAESKRFTEPARRRGPSRSASPKRSQTRVNRHTGVLFDFDGTLGDTEKPAMEVAFWMLAPYLVGLEGKSDEDLNKECPLFVRENAGKAFEHMIENCDKQREAAGLQGVEATRSARQEHAGLLAAVDQKRLALGLRRVADLRAEGSEPATLLQQQKDDTVTRLAVAAEACPGVIPALQLLKSMGIRSVIATTSGKPRVPVCVDTAGLRSFFPSDELSIHSGESDFDPPCFKPAPDVYLRAASYVKLAPNTCIAVEDSASGVGSASNAGIGLIVGYVGAGHIAREQKESHAQMLMKGTRADNGRGADVVLEDMCDLPQVVQYFSGLVESGQRVDGHSRVPLTQTELPNLSGKAYFAN